MENAERIMVGWVEWGHVVMVVRMCEVVAREFTP